VLLLLLQLLPLGHSLCIVQARPHGAPPRRRGRKAWVGALHLLAWPTPKAGGRRSGDPALLAQRQAIAIAHRPHGRAHGLATHEAGGT
jgi:hypothetical protein